MSWAWSFYLREWSSLYKYKRIMSSHFCSEWSLWSSLSKMSKMSNMLIMLTVITLRLWLLNDYLIIVFSNHLWKSSNIYKMCYWLRDSWDIKKKDISIFYAIDKKESLLILSMLNMQFKRIWINMIVRT